MGSERRVYPRSDARLEIRFSSPKAFLQQYTTNISKGGLFVQMDKPFERDTEVELVIHLPRTRREVTVKGRVVHSVPGLDEDPGGVGVEFTDMSAENRKTFEAYIIALQEKKAKGRL